MRQRRFDQQRHAGPVVAEQDSVLEQRVGEDEALDGLRRDVLAAQGDDDVLDAVGDDQEPVDVDVSGVPGVQPAVGVDGGGGGLLVVPVPGHHVRAAEQHLTVFADVQLPALEYPPRRADLEPARRVEGHQRRGLGQPVAGVDGHPDRREELLDLLAQRRPTAGQDRLVAAQGDADRGQDEPVGHAELGAPEPRRSPSLAVGPLVAGPHPQRPLEDATFDPRGSDLRVSGREHLLVQLGDAHEQRRFRMHQGLGDGAGVGNVGVHAAFEQDDAGPGPLQRVREG